VEEVQKFPIPNRELDQMKGVLNGGRNKNVAFIFGHGLWNNLELQKTLSWLDMLITTITSIIGSDWHGIFVTPSAAGKGKPNEYLVAQGNKALMLFEEAVGVEVAKRGLEHLGTWNMSIQANKFDGVHLDMRGNLVKAMMVLNWLSLIEQ
jgi:hypothetical protein